MATLDPEFDRRLRALLTAGGEAGYNPQVASGYRTESDQARAIDGQAQKVYGRPASVVDYARGIPGYAAPVGGSMHERGQAADLSGNGVDWARQNAASYGIRFPESLRGTDPNHAEIDPKFWGPVQDPRDRAATMAAAQAEPQAPGTPAQPMMARAPVEIPASKGGIGPNGTPNPPQVAGYQPDRSGRMSLGMTTPAGSDPRMAPQPEQSGGLLGGIAKFATNTFTNPLFQAGAAMVNAGSRGTNVGGGFLEGANAAAQASERQQADAKRQREVASEQSRAALWQDMVTNPNPVWAKEIDPGTMQLARVMGPVDGMNLIMGLVQKNQVGQLDRMNYDEKVRKNNIDAAAAEAQRLEAQNMNNERRDMMRSQTELRRQQMEQEAAAARRRAEFLGEDPPAAAAPAQPRPVPQAPPVMTPRRMSDEVQPADPMLIPTQAVTPPSAPVPAAPAPAADPPKMVQTTRGPMTPQQAREFGTRMLIDPELRAVGQSYIKQADAIEEAGGLTNGAKTEVDKTLVSAVGSLGRVMDLAKDFDPKYLKIAYRGKQAFNDVYSKFGDLSPEAEADQNRYVQFRSEAVRHVSTLLKELSGAAVTQQELDRALLAEPNAGSGGWLDVFAADGPPKFKAKLEASIQFSRKAIARANYLRNAKGFSAEQIAEASKNGTLSRAMGLNDVDVEYRRMSNELRDKFKAENPKSSDDQIRERVKTQLKGVFGI